MLPAPFAPLRRRDWLRAAAAALALPGAAAWALPPRTLEFPRDFGSHPDLRTEWWYITGHVRASAQLYGFQVTFFRSRVDAARDMRSELAARQLVFAHAALTDLGGHKLYHDQRIARAGLGIAEAATHDTAIHLRDWSLVRVSAPGSRYTAHIETQDFGLDLTLQATQPPLLQGAQGLSRKGPEPEQASYYYSEPQLAVSGSLMLRGQRLTIDDAPAPANRAWMDHEWSEALMHPEAVGWDWIGMNLDDGSALTAFRLRRADGSTVWTGGSLRKAGNSAVQVFANASVRFTAQRTWTSSSSRAVYPVHWHIATPAGDFAVRALLDDQELDSRSSTGAIYWEGLCDLLDAQGSRVGRGYLEMTGYADRLQLN